MLSLLDDEEALAEAIEIARDLGAEPLTRRVNVRMRDLGCASHAASERRRARIPPASRAGSWRFSPFGRRTDERGDRRTARRLTTNGRAPCRRSAPKLGAATRRDAARRAFELGLLLGT